MDEMQFLRIYDFSGGLNDWGSSYALRDNEAQETLNCRLDEQGMLQKREGRSVVASTSLPAAACDGAARFYGNSISGTPVGVLTVKAGTKLYTVNVADGTTVDALAALYTAWGDDYDLTAGQRMRVAQWGDDRTYIALGTGAEHDEALVTGQDSIPSALHKMGAKAPTNAPQSADSTTDGVTTVDKYYNVATTITYGPSGAWGESIPLRDPTAHKQVNGAKKVAVSSYDDINGALAWRTKYGAYSVKVYSTEPQDTAVAAQGAPLYYTGQEDVAGAGWVGAAAFANADIDITLPAPSTFDTGDVPHDDLDFVCVHNARLYVNSPARPDRVYYSNLNVPDEFPSQNWFDTNGSVTGMASAPFGLTVFTKNGIEIWRGWGSGDFSHDTLHGVQGCVAPDSIAQITMRGKQVIVYAGENGIYGFDGHTSEYLGTTPDGAGMKIAGTWKNYATSKSAAQGVAYKDYYLLAYQDTRDEGAYNNRVLAYDIRYDCWWLWDGWDVGAWAHFFGDVDDDELYYGDSSATGKIHECMTGVDDCQWLWVSRDFPLAGPETNIQARKAWVEIEEDSLPINVVVRADGGERSDVFTLPSGDTSTWDNVTWDNFTWERLGTDTVCIGKPLEDSIIGRRLAVKVEQTDAENKKLVGVSVGYYVRGRL